MKDNQIDWYGYGWAAFRCSTSIPAEYLPPLEDQELQLQWLDGFLAARIDNPDTPHWSVSPPSSVYNELKSRFEKEHPQYWEVFQSLFKTENFIGNEIH